jgi:hypothetical protein
MWGMRPAGRRSWCLVSGVRISLDGKIILEGCFACAA